LWEYINEEGRLRFTHPVDSPLPVEAYLSLVGKYSHLSKEQIAHVQETVDKQIGILKSFAVEGTKITSGEVAARMSELRQVSSQPSV
jgi:phenylglyoxylate dehydrogenase beta subunit